MTTTELQVGAQVLSECAADYHARDAVSNSRLNDFLGSPRLYEGRYVLGDVPPRKRTDAFRVGGALHAWALEPEQFEQAIAVAPEEVLGKPQRGEDGVMRDGTTNTNAWRAWAEEHAGKTLVKPREWEKTTRLRRALFCNPAVEELFANTVAREESIVWQDAATGLTRKARLDMRTTLNGWPVIADLKSTRSVNDFAGAIAEYSYYRQGAYYLDAVADHAANCSFVLIALSTEEPYRSRVYEVDSKLLEIGREEIRAGLQRLLQCYETGDWSDEGEGTVTLVRETDLPRWWAYRRDE